jgi:acyl carrier protein
LDHAGNPQVAASNALDERICRIASDVLGVSVDELTRESSPDTVVTWDSVAHLSLVLAVEQELGIQIDYDELDSLTSIGALADTARRYLDGSV